MSKTAERSKTHRETWREIGIVHVSVAMPEKLHAAIMGALEVTRCRYLLGIISDDETSVQTLLYLASRNSMRPVIDTTMKDMEKLAKDAGLSKLVNPILDEAFEARARRKTLMEDMEKGHVPERKLLATEAEVLWKHNLAVALDNYAFGILDSGLEPTVFNEMHQLTGKDDDNSNK